MIKEKIDPIEYLQVLLRDSYYARPVLESVISLLQKDKQDGEVKFLDWYQVMDEAHKFELEIKSAAHAFGVARDFIVSLAADSEEQEGEEQ
jgi:hypothetical protein